MLYNYEGCTLYGQNFAEFYTSSTTDLEDIFYRKYQNDRTFADEYDWRSGINERLLRYADILLMYAECLNENGNTSQSYDYIQMVEIELICQI
ncbi:MAG: RagB/SusD family nutrient uptake outer membrane protein [Saprospiraceae bacterium]